MGKYEGLTPVAGYGISNDSGILIYEANDEYVIAGFVCGSKPPLSVRKHKVHWDTEEPYFKKNGVKIPLSECMRINS